MFRVTRIAVAAVLAVAVAALPLILDRCAASCDAHQGTVATGSTCHHVTATGTHLTPAPASCSHDHNGTAVTAANGFAQTGRAFALVATASSQPSVLPPAETGVRVAPHAAPDLSPPLAARSLPLRV
jgi:hypothetical protein